MVYFTCVVNGGWQWLRAAEDVSGWSRTTVKLFSLSLYQLDFAESNLNHLEQVLFLKGICSDSTYLFIPKATGQIILYNSFFSFTSFLYWNTCCGSWLLLNRGSSGTDTKTCFPYFSVLLSFHESTVFLACSKNAGDALTSMIGQSCSCWQIHFLYIMPT